MRVVAGSAKGRKLKAPRAPGTRPVMDRVKTALFDILAPRIVDTRFLDLFAGTGSIGIEALSRGAARATFVELSAEALGCIRDNLATTGLTAQSEVLRADAFGVLASVYASAQRYDMVYVAPPQYQGLAARALSQLDRDPVTAPGGLVIVQIDPRERAALDGLALQRLQLRDERRYGSTLLLFYDHLDDSDDSDDSDNLAQAVATSEDATAPTAAQEKDTRDVEPTNQVRLR